MDYIIVGCGGIGARLAEPLIRQIPRDSNLTLMDGDKLEEHNFDRQMFPVEALGEFKTKALKKSLLQYDPNRKVRTRNSFLRIAVPPKHEEPPTLFVCVDNLAGRLAALHYADFTGGTCIIGGNELIEAEAMYYKPDWQETARDPRVMYPNWLEDGLVDPTHSCTGEAQERHPQLALANMQAATHMLWLWYIWENTRPELDNDASLPHHVRANHYGHIQVNKGVAA